MPEITEIKAYSLELPLKEAFETAKGRKTSSPAVAVELWLSNGMIGYGSATPVKYVTGEDIESVLAAVGMCTDDLCGADASSYRPLLNALSEALPDQPSARAALEIAVLDAFCKLYGIPMCKFFGGMLSEVETDVTISITTPDNARKLAKEAAVGGFNSIKIKVGSADTENDFAQVIAISEGAPQCAIRLDANQGFAPEAAVDFISRVQSAGVNVEMVEQPVDCKDLDGLRYITQHTSVPVFADESVVTPSDALKLVQMDAVDGINIKLMKAGIAGALDIIAICKAAGKGLMLGSMIETDIGMATAVHLAAGTGVFRFLDLDAHLLAVRDTVPFSGGFTFDGPRLIPDAVTPGHGCRPAGS